MFASCLNKGEVSNGDGTGRSTVYYQKSNSVKNKMFTSLYSSNVLYVVLKYHMPGVSKSRRLVLFTTHVRMSEIEIIHVAR